MARADLEGGPGTVTQVRECGLALLHFAKATHTSVVLVGHVTKDGTVAGPRVLEHMVDAVLYLEGERYQHYRVLRAAKNRFGATHELGVFEMTERGLRRGRQSERRVPFRAGPAPRALARHRGGREPRGLAAAAGRGAGAGLDLVLRHAAAGDERLRCAPAGGAARGARAARGPAGSAATTCSSR